MARATSVIRIAVFALLALALGFVGLSLLFSDLGPGETFRSRMLVTALFFLLSGLIIGYFNARIWWLGGLVSWGGALLGIVGLLSGLSNIAERLFFLLISVGPAFLGAYLGGLLGRRWPIGRLFRRDHDQT